MGRIGWAPIDSTRHARGSRTLTVVFALLCAPIVLASCGGVAKSPVGKAAVVVTTTTTQASNMFDPSVGAPLPNNRIVAAYGIVGGGPPNGPASTLDSLAAFLPQLQQLGQQYAALDPIHPVKLGIDLVVNVLQPCGDFPKWCASWVDDQTMQAYIDYCQQHNLLLFFDVQLGTEPVSDAVTNHLATYLTKYPFTELALDTEFHFPNTPDGYAKAQGYPCCLGWMNASEINWAINDLAQISVQNRVPRKVLIVHQWNPAVLPDKDGVKLNPNVSIVLQSDGFGGYDNKLGDYQVFVQQDLLEYGGYKLFYDYCPGSCLAYDIDANGNAQVQSPQDVLNLFPQPLFVSYQ
ncbi:MAG TPA: hypothetical protein VJN88_08125 [Ktedonobacterales bacterium]|nr:hypothetical protein [Ktedonobacterales bacterium]